MENTNTTNNAEHALTFHRAAVSALKKAYEKANLPFDLRTIEMAGPEIDCPDYNHYKLLWLKATLSRRLETEIDETQIKKLKTKIRKLNKEIITSAKSLTK